MSAVDGVRKGRVTCFGMFNAAQGAQDVVILAEAAAAGADRDKVRAEISRAMATELGFSPNGVKVVDAGVLIKSSSGKISRKLMRS